MVFQKGNFELIVNGINNDYFDEFFYYITYLGDGWASVIIILLLLFFRLYNGLLALISFLMSTIIVQGIKRLIFPDLPRPIKFFDHKVQLHLIDGLQIHETHSFPSGHSSGAFSVFIILCLMAREKLWSLLFFNLALMVTISRIYLMQHFFIDTFIGAIIGALMAIFTFYYFQYQSPLRQNEVLQKPLLTIFNHKWNILDF